MDFSKQLTKSTWQVMKTYIKRGKTLFFKETRYAQNIYKIFCMYYQSPNSLLAQLFV